MCILLGKTCGHSMFLACIDFCMSESTYSKSHMGSAHSILNILSVHGWLSIKLMGLITFFHWLCLVTHSIHKWHGGWLMCEHCLTRVLSKLVYSFVLDMEEKQGYEYRVTNQLKKGECQLFNYIIIYMIGRNMLCSLSPTPSSCVFPVSNRFRFTWSMGGNKSLHYLVACAFK